MLRDNVSLVNRCKTVQSYIKHALCHGCTLKQISYHYMISISSVERLLDGEVIYLHKSIYRYMLQLWFQLMQANKKQGGRHAA